MFLNLYDRIYHDKPISYFIEMLTFSLLTLGVKKNLADFFCGDELKRPAIREKSVSFFSFSKTFSFKKIYFVYEMVF